MRLSTILALTGLALGATACATAPTRLVAPADASAPQPLANHDWFFNAPDAEGDGRAGLMYGAEESDDIWVYLSCTPRSGALTISQPAVTDHPILLESGGDTETYPAKAEPDELHDVLLHAEARTADPVFLRFRRLGWLATHSEAGRVMMAAQPGSAGRVSDFFAVCG